MYNQLSLIFTLGLFVDALIEVAKKELSWECNYIREKECTQHYSKLISQYPQYYVPEVIEELTTGKVRLFELK